MNVADYTYLINNPQTITENQTAALEKVLDEFPFFQSARALRLKGLHNQSSFKYNFALKIAAAHSTDRSVLFDFITSNPFSTVKNVVPTTQSALFEDKNTETDEASIAEKKIGRFI